MFSFLSIKDGIYIAVILSMIGGGRYILEDWHYEPIEKGKQCEIDKVSISEGYLVTIEEFKSHIETNEAEKEKLQADIATAYSDGYYKGLSSELSKNNHAPTSPYSF